MNNGQPPKCPAAELLTRLIDAEIETGHVRTKIFYHLKQSGVDVHSLDLEGMRKQLEAEILRHAVE